MLKIGLTGGIASGKTAVGKMFATLGAHFIAADGIAHNLMKPGQPVYLKIVEQFGDEILNADGTVNRAKLADAAFGSAATDSRFQIEELNRIVHPAVIQAQEEWMDQTGLGDSSSIAIVEAALIVEADLVKHFDKIVVVTCHPEQRVERWANRLKVSRESAQLEITRRMAAQLPDELKIKVADYLIDNSNTLTETEGQVKSVYEHLRRQMAKPNPRLKTDS